ncbi:hypothetical protein HMPREF0127_04746 [Bacteroides sp. 1_1_30]|nr:hypothetical protein HMPREF0127_04746 [Bacteroides sp. 1_1_30]
MIKPFQGTPQNYHLAHFRTEMNYNGLPAYVVNQNKSSKR